MTLEREARKDQRLKLRYPIRVEGPAGAGAGGVLARTVTHNVGARGAYFTTFDGESFHPGQSVVVTVSVPHRLDGGPEVLLDLRGEARVVRVEGPEVHRKFGEDGRILQGVAVAFPRSLSFQYRWV